jgi:hypothetical protein
VVGIGYLVKPELVGWLEAGGPDGEAYGPGSRCRLRVL